MRIVSNPPPAYFELAVLVLLQDGREDVFWRCFHKSIHVGDVHVVGHHSGALAGLMTRPSLASAMRSSSMISACGVSPCLDVLLLTYARFGSSSRSRPPGPRRTSPIMSKPFSKSFLRFATSGSPPSSRGRGWLVPEWVGLVWRAKGPPD